MSDFFDLWHDERLDSTEQLGFAIAATNAKAELVVEDALVDWGGRRFFVAETETIREGTRDKLAVRCNALWYRLAEAKRPGSTLLTELTPAAGLEAILDSTGWTVTGTTESNAASGTYSMEEQDSTVLGLIRVWANIVGGFVVFDTWAKQVGVVASRGKDVGAAFRYGRNLTSIKRRAEPPAVTRLYPYGADGLKVSGINGGKEYVEDFTYYTNQGLTLDEARASYTKSEIASDSSFVDESDLLAWAVERVGELAQPLVSYECKVIDLSGMDPAASEERLDVGDTARVYDGPLGIDVSTTVVRLKRYPLEPHRDLVELAYLYAPAKPTSATSRVHV